MTTRIYHLRAYNLYDSLSIKALRGLYENRVRHASPLEMQVELGEDSYLFLYRFGTIAFFNVSDEVEKAEIQRLKAEMPAVLAVPNTEQIDVRIGAGAEKVDLEGADIRRASLPALGLIAMTISQSAALEYFETKAESMLTETAEVLLNLARHGAVPWRSRRLLRFIGSAAGTRQTIISNLAILDSPEATTTSHEMHKLFQDLQRVFDIDTRFKALDRKLSLVQDNIGILSDLATSRKAVILEILVIVLIVVEIALALWGG